MREFFWEHSRIPQAEIKRNGGTAWIEIDANPLTRESLKLDPWPITLKPENFIVLIVAAADIRPTASGCRATARE